MISIRKQIVTQQKHQVSPFIFALLVKCVSILKVSFIVGSYTAFFSAISIIAPLAGAFTGIAGSCIVFALMLITKMFFGASLLSFKFLAFIIPGFFASLYWSSSSVFIRLLLPLAAMVAFIAHPAVGAGWVYSLYWLIPILRYLFSLCSKTLRMNGKITHFNDSIFMQALGSTFTAHAVGSVIWLYADPMMPAVWLGLIPVVFIERMLFATGMVLAYHAINYANHAWKNLAVVVFKKHIA